MNDKDTTEDEVNKLKELCKTRKKAFTTIMKQSGITPLDIKQVKTCEKITRLHKRSQQTSQTMISAQNEQKKPSARKNPA